MTHINDSTIMATSKDNHCIEEMSLSAQNVQTYAGQCGESGSIYSGFRLLLRLTSPYGVTFDGTSTLYISLNSIRTLMLINLNDGAGELVCQTSSKIRIIRFDVISGDVFASYDDGFGQISPSSKSEQMLFRGTSGIGSLENTGLKYGGGLEQMQAGVRVVADHQNNR